VQSLSDSNAVVLIVSEQVAWIGLWAFALLTSLGQHRRDVLLMFKVCVVGLLLFSAFWAVQSFQGLHQGLTGLLPGFIFGCVLGGLWMFASGVVASAIVLIGRKPG